MPESYQTSSAVLFLIFNRPDTTKQVFEAIRGARPRRLYVAADGPRPNRPGEPEKCEATRSIATAIDWPCELITLFRAENLGCGRAVSGAVSWFFEHEEEGIVLEDDCLPEPTFFPYVDELLERYRNDSRVALVSGNNHQRQPRRNDTSYYFSQIPHIWGWATWRRAWERYDFAMARWPEVRSNNWLLDVLGSKKAVEAWVKNFDHVHTIDPDTWDFQWVFNIWCERMAVILPGVNLVRNLGFGSDATHTTGGEEHNLSSRSFPMAFPLRHPNHFIVDSVADQRTFAAEFIPLSFHRKVVRKLKKWAGLT